MGFPVILIKIKSAYPHPPAAHPLKKKKKKAFADKPFVKPSQGVIDSKCFQGNFFFLVDNSF